MEIILGIIVLLALIFGGIWFWEKIQDLFFGAVDSVASFFDGSAKTRSEKAKGGSHSPASLQVLPEPLEAHDTLEAFCRIMHKIDIAMSPYCQYEGQASLVGGIDEQGKGYAHFWYDKDHAGVDSVLRDIGYYSPDENGNQTSVAGKGDNGWSIQDGVVHYKSKAITGYREWTGYNTLYKQFGKDAAESSMQKMIEAVINNEWPEARITSYSGYFDAPSGEPICFSIRIRTKISTI